MTPLTDFGVRVTANEHGIGVLEWDQPTDPETLERAVGLAADDSMLGHQLRRLEVALPVGDRMGRRAVHRAGFRLEGVRRQAFARADGGFEDVCLYARLVDDQVYGASGFSAVMNTVLPKKRAIGHVVFRNEAGQVLLCQTHFKPDKELPGGVVENRESPQTGAIREVAEELGLEVDSLRLKVVDWMPPSLGWDDALEFIFDGGVLTASQIDGLVKQPSEIKSLHWIDPADLAEHVSPISARRLEIALSLAEGEIACTEDGVRS